MFCCGARLARLLYCAPHNNESTLEGRCLLPSSSPSCREQEGHLAMEPALQDTSAALPVMVSVRRRSRGEILQILPMLEKGRPTNISLSLFHWPSCQNVAHHWWRTSTAGMGSFPAILKMISSRIKPPVKTRSVLASQPHCCTGFCNCKD